MLKLTLIFKSVLWAQAYLVWRTHLLHLKQQFTYFLSIIQWKKAGKNIFFKNGVMYELHGLFI